MDFAFSKEMEMLRKAVREFATKKIAPFAHEWDANHYFPYKEVVKPMGELGLFGTVIPETYGGDDMGWLAAMIVTEEIHNGVHRSRRLCQQGPHGCLAHGPCRVPAHAFE